jgi:lipoprotein NlpI
MNNRIPSSLPKRCHGLAAIAALWLLAFPACAQAPGSSARELFARAVADFENGRIAESTAAFDRVAELDPAGAPHLWQRGIALYYAGRYADCREQFESHRTVNPNDVENAAWHFLCVARAESPAKARAALLPVGPDSRAPMSEIYQMFRGAIPPARVLSAAGVEPDPQFYAQLYVGLYYEALGNNKGALEHIAIAADDRYASGGYMHMVARVHLRLLRNRP